MTYTERPVDAALKQALVNNEPLQYAHLIKFERPSLPDATSGQVSTSKQRYSYLTDASINIAWDDGSTDLTGAQNGVQTYLANKVLSVGQIQETTKATAGTTSLVLDGTAVGGYLQATITVSLVSTGVWNIVFPDLQDLLDQGFREGDKVEINGITVNIHSFRADQTLRVTKVDTDLTVGTYSVTVHQASEELLSILLNKNSDDYASFINRYVYIYTAYFQDGAMLGQPTLMFRGIISATSFEDSESGIKVSWTLSNHWGDFAQIKGRITSDSSHRALDENGYPQPFSALKTAYAYDKGFNHAETSVHLLAKYIVKVEKMEVTYKKGFLGIGAGVRTRTYYVDEDRYTNLDFELAAKAIPVVYGVRLVEGIPVFGDTLNDNSSVVYVASVLSEGEIGGIYDLYIGGNSLICNDYSDYDARSAQTSDNTVALVCRGRSDKGDVLGGQIVTEGTYSYYTDTGEKISLSSENYITDWSISGYNILNYDYQEVQYNNYGIIDGETISLQDPSVMDIDFFSGKTGQLASAQLAKIAYDKNFKVQNSYWTGSDTSEYWGPNHKLLDTAYVVGRFEINEGETTIPEISYVIRGKVINCYNYDYSFSQYPKSSGESADNFLLGDLVDLYYNGTLIHSQVQIIDKWTMIRPDGTKDTRFRYNVVPDLQYDVNGVPIRTSLQMRKGTYTWTMIAYNYLYALGTVPGPVASTITGVGDVGGYVQFNFSMNADMTVVTGSTETSPMFQVAELSLAKLTSGDTFPAAIMTGLVSSEAFKSQMPYNQFSSEAVTLVGKVLVSQNTIRLASSASTVDDYYKDSLIELVKYNSTTGKTLTQELVVIGYNGATKIATLGSILDFNIDSTVTYKIYPRYADKRVSINPVIQLLDYTTSPSYGRGLSYTQDLYFPSWLETARKCDTKSDVTALFTTTTAPAVGDVYKLLVDSKLVWQGRVTSSFDSGTKYYSTFTDCIGKLSNQWNDWKEYSVGDIIYTSTYQYFKIIVAGIIATEPIASTSQVTLITSLSLTKISGSGPASLVFNLTNGNFVQSLRNGVKISGYSLYDADDINYWRMSGWDEHAQRYATKSQTNLIIDTSASLFDNTNSFLEHFNGILRHTGGKYHLGVEEKEADLTQGDIRIITADDIIGKIQLSDEGTKSAFNSLTAAFADPANKFEARNISFYNSDYLKADKNVPKKGNLSIPGITNYYNTRLLADGFLNRSRYGLTVSFTVRTHGILFLAGTVIQLVYPRYRWTGKKFRIDTVTYQPDGTADIVAKEYDDSFYSLANIKGVKGTGASTAIPVVTLSSTSAPRNLVVSQDRYNQIELQWYPGDNADPNSLTEVWRSNDTNFNNAELIALVPVTPNETNYYTDSISPSLTGGDYLSRYYWVRRRIIS